MFVPSVAAIALLWAGAVEEPDALVAIEHIGMFPAMLLRLDEYTRQAAPAISRG